MRGRLTLAGLCVGLVAAVGSPAGAAASCTMLTDPSGDVRTDGGLIVPDGHLDVTSVAITRSPQDLTFTIHQTGLEQQRKGEWRLTFASERGRLYVFAGLGMWVNVGNYTGPSGFTAGGAGRRAVRVQGDFDHARSEIRITVPLRALGLSARSRLSSFAVEAKEVFANLSPTVPGGQATKLVDEGRSGATYKLGRGCSR